MKLVRDAYRFDGVFGRLFDEKDHLVAYTLEHSYIQDDKTWKPKLPSGQFICVLGPHRLHGMTSDFQTFEITGVPGHSNILFHWGNFDKDSEGCVLLGAAVVTQADGTEMVTHSKDTFKHFMDSKAGVKEFMLRVQA